MSLIPKYVLVDGEKVTPRVPNKSVAAAYMDGQLTYAKQYDVTSDSLPIEFKSRLGTKLDKWSITGDTVQNGTPGIQTSNNLFNQNNGCWQDGHTWTDTGADNTVVNRFRNNGYSAVTDGQTYTINADKNAGAGLWVFAFFYDSDKRFHSRPGSGWSMMPYSFTVPSGAAYVRFVFNTQYISTPYTSADIQWVMLNKGSTALPYEPYPETEMTDNLLNNYIFELGGGTSSLVAEDDSVTFSALSVNTYVNSGKIDISDTTYAFSYDANSDVTPSMKCYSADDTFLGNANVLSSGTSGDRQYYIFTTLSNTANIRLVLTTSVSGKITINKPMLNSGGQVKSFVPYGAVEKLVSVPVKMVGDRTENLLDVNAWFDKLMKTSVPVFRGTIEKTGNSIILTADDNDCHTYYGSAAYTIPVKPNTQYVLSWNSRRVVGNGGLIYVFFNASVSTGTYVAAQDSLGKLQFTTNSDTTFITFRLGANTSGNVVEYSNLMLNPGSTPLPYEPSGYKIPVVTRGKNLFDGTYDVGYSGTYPNILEDASGKSSEWIDTNKINNVLTCVLQTNTESSAVVGYVSSNDRNEILNRVGITNMSRVEVGKEFIISFNSHITGIKQHKYVKFYYQRRAYFDYLGIYLTSETKYTPYHTPITTNIYLPTPLAKGEVLRSDGSREVKWKEVVLTGEELFSYYQSTNAMRYELMELRETLKPLSTMYSSHFNPALGGNPGGISNNTSTTNPRCWLFSDIQTVGEFKSWLKSQYDAGTPVTVYYQLATPTTETIPDLPAIPTIKGTTVIDVDTEVKPESMSVTYR